MISNLLSVLIVLLPAAYAAWSGRRLLRRPDDPLFAELHFARAQRLMTLLLICYVAGSLVSSERITLKLLLAALTLAVAQHAYRKQVFRETWSVIGYIGHFLRLLGLYGVWLLVGVAPSCIIWAGSLALPVAIALGATVLAMSQLNAQMVRWLLAATPISDPDLEARFDEILARASCRRPAVLAGGPEGGFWMNGLAVPSPYRPAVVLSRDLLACLGPREVTAIFAHEVAHLEKHLRGWPLAAGNLILGLFTTVALVAPFMLGLSTGGAFYFVAFWPFAVIIRIALQAVRNQRWEHESDLRAFELSGDAPALIDALTKLHVLSQMPRRWAARSEATATHPSLAQRLRAIRDAAGMAAPSPGGGADAAPELAVVAADGSDRAAVLAADRAYWLAGVTPGTDSAALDATELRRSAPDCRSILYCDLADLRLVAGGSRKQRLVATDRRGQTLQLPVRPADVPAVLATLERVEQALPGTAPGISQFGADSSTRSIWVRLLALLLVLAGALPPSSGTLSLAAFLVFLRPAAGTLAAAGSIAVVAGLHGVWDFAASPPSDAANEDGTTLLAGIIFLLTGCYLAVLALRRFRAWVEEPRWVRWGAPAVLIGAVALSLAEGLLRLVFPLPGSQVHAWARQGPAAILWLVGLAAIFFTTRRLVARLAAVGSLAVAAGLLVIGSSWFGERVDHDPLAGPAPPLAIGQLSLQKVREVRLPENPWRLALSPSGRIAYSTDYEGYDPGFGEHDGFQVELAGGGFVAVGETSDLEFVDDERVVALMPEDERTVLRILRLAAEPVTELDIVLPALEDHQLRLDPAGERWQVTGVADDGAAGESREMVRLEGDVGGVWEQTHRVALPAAGDHSAVASYLDAGGRLLTVDSEFGLRGPLEGSRAGMLLAMISGTMSTRIITHSASGRRRVAESTRMLHCFEPAFGAAGFLCAALGEEAAELWAIDAERGGFEPIGWVPDLPYIHDVANDGRVLASGDALVFVDPAVPKLWRIDSQLLAEPAVAETLSLAGDEPDWESDEEEDWDPPLSRFGPPAVALRSGLMAVAIHGGEGAVVMVYRQPNAPGVFVDP